MGVALSALPQMCSGGLGLSAHLSIRIFTDLVFYKRRREESVSGRTAWLLSASWVMAVARLRCLFETEPHVSQAGLELRFRMTLNYPVFISQCRITGECSNRHSLRHRRASPELCARQVRYALSHTPIRHHFFFVSLHLGEDSQAICWASLLCTSRCPRIHFVSQSGLVLRDPPAQVF